MTNTDTYILKTKENGQVITVRDVQLRILEILREFDRICQKYEIPYILAFGSTLGAVRHGGFIPWDDDLDVLMTYDSYFRLLEVLPKELEAPFYYHCFEHNPCYNVTIPAMKIRLEGTYVEEVNTLLKNKCPGNGLFLDVFIFDHMAVNKNVHLLHRVLSSALMPPIILLENLGFNPLWLKRRFYQYALWYARHYQASPDVYFTLTWTFDGFKDKRVRYDDLFPAIRVPFEDGEYPIPNNADAYLKIAYGDDYMTPPALANRVPKHIKDVDL